MLFSSWKFFALFLPITVLVYFTLNKYRLVRAGQVWLVIASLFFYGYWEAKYLLLITASILVNFAFGTWLARSYRWNAADGDYVPFRRPILVLAIAMNLVALGFFKYAGFAIANINFLVGKDFPAPHIVLPLAISFFTFTQIVYLVDSYRGETGHYNLLNYALFVLFFPHLIAGPIVQHSQIMPQFMSKWTLLPRYANINRGLFIFAIGLFKKLVIADIFAVWADAGFDGTGPLTFFAAWAASFSYTFQLYFDFSGYCDMAIGASLLFNIYLPINFESPYKATSIQDFWRRWHITLSNFLRDFVYIPLGGSRGSEFRTYIIVAATFLLGGLWHGPTWMFVLWGAAHGTALVIQRVWSKMHISLFKPLGWFLTFMFVNLAWVLFRAETPASALRIYKGMVNWRSIFAPLSPAIPTEDLAWSGRLGDTLLTILPATLIGPLVPLLAATLALLIVFQKNSIDLAGGAIGYRKTIAGGMMFAVAAYFSIAGTSTVFLYFNF